MSDNLDRLIDAIEGEGPSPEFVANLRERIVNETQALAEVRDRVLEIEAPPSGGRPLRGQALGRWLLTTAAAVIIVGFIMLGGDDNEGTVEIIDQPEVEVTEEPTSIPGGGAGLTAPPATFDAAATLMTTQELLGSCGPCPSERLTLEAGSYRFDTVGTPFSLTLNEPLGLHQNGLAQVVLTMPNSQGSDDRSIHVLRLSTLSDPTNPLDAIEAAGDGWPADDLDGWLENLSEDVRVSDRRDVMLGGLNATRFDLELARECEISTSPCAVLGTNRLVTSKDLGAEGIYRIWIVDQGDEDPLAVVAAVGRSIDRDWFESAERLVSTFAFGEVAPNPIASAEPGTIDLPYLGGVRIDLPEGSYVLTHPSDAVLLADWPGATRFLSDLRHAGAPLASVDDLLDVLGADPATVTEGDPTTVGGLAARVLDIERFSSPSELEFNGWTAPTRGRMWLIEHPERGLLIISADVLDNADIVFPLVLDQTEAILSTLEFIEPA